MPGHSALPSKRYGNRKADADRDTPMMIITEVRQEIRLAYALMVNYAAEPRVD